MLRREKILENNTLTEYVQVSYLVLTSFFITTTLNLLTYSPSPSFPFPSGSADKMGSDGTTTKQKKKKGNQSRGKNPYYLVTRVKEGDKKHDEYYYARKVISEASIRFRVSSTENYVKHQHYISGGTVSKPITLKHGKTYQAGRHDAFYTVISGPHDSSAGFDAAPAALVLDSSTFEPSSTSTSSRKPTQRSKRTRSTPPEAETSTMIENPEDALSMSTTDTSAANPLTLKNLSSLKRKSPPAPGPDDMDDKPQSSSKRRPRQRGVSFAIESDTSAPISFPSSSRTPVPFSPWPAQVIEALTSTSLHTPFISKQLGNTGSTKAVIRECTFKDTTCTTPASVSGSPWWRFHERLGGIFTPVFKADNFDGDIYCNTCRANKPARAGEINPKTKTAIASIFD